MNYKYNNYEYNDKERINVRIKVVDGGGIGEGFGTTDSYQQRKLPDDKDKYKDEDNGPSLPPPPTEGAYI